MSTPAPHIDSDVTFARSPGHVDAYIIDGTVVPATLLQVLAEVVRHRTPQRTLVMLQDIRDYGALQEHDRPR
jgi:hypothetical protein